MSERTEQIVESLLQAPPLVEFLKRDPARLLTTLVNCEQGQAAIKAGTRLIGDLLNRYVDATPRRQTNLTQAPGSRLSAVTPGTSQITEISPESGSSSSVAILSATSLAAVGGSLTLLGIVSIVALKGRDK